MDKIQNQTTKRLLSNPFAFNEKENLIGNCSKLLQDQNPEDPFQKNILEKKSENTPNLLYTIPISDILPGNFKKLKSPFDILRGVKELTEDQDRMSVLGPHYIETNPYQRLVYELRAKGLLKNVPEYNKKFDKDCDEPDSVLPYNFINQSTNNITNHDKSSGLSKDKTDNQSTNNSSKSTNYHTSNGVSENNFKSPIFDNSDVKSISSLEKAILKDQKHHIGGNYQDKDYTFLAEKINNDIDDIFEEVDAEFKSAPKTTTLINLPRLSKAKTGLQLKREAEERWLKAKLTENQSNIIPRLSFPVKAESTNNMLERNMHRKALNYPDHMYINAFRKLRTIEYYERIYNESHVVKKPKEEANTKVKEKRRNPYKENGEPFTSEEAYGIGGLAKTKFANFGFDLDRVVFKYHKSRHVIARRQTRIRYRVKKIKKQIEKQYKETGKKMRIGDLFRYPRENKRHLKVRCDFNDLNLPYPERDTMRSAISKVLEDPSYIKSYINSCIEVSTPLIKDILSSDASALDAKFVNDTIPEIVTKIIRAFEVCSKERKLVKDVLRTKKRVVIPRYIFKFVKYYLKFDEVKEYFSDKHLLVLKYEGRDLLVTEKEYLESFCSLPLKRCIFETWRDSKFTSKCLDVKVSTWANEQKKKTKDKRLFKQTEGVKKALNKSKK